MSDTQGKASNRRSVRELLRDEGIRSTAANVVVALLVAGARRLFGRTR